MGKLERHAADDLADIGTPPCIGGCQMPASAEGLRLLPKRDGLQLSGRLPGCRLAVDTKHAGADCRGGLSAATQQPRVRRPGTKSAPHTASSLLTSPEAARPA